LAPEKFKVIILYDDGMVDTSKASDLAISVPGRPVDPHVPECV